MSENKYGEPWHPFGATIRDDKGQLIATVAGEHRDRIIACVNAMAGIDDPAQLRAENERLQTRIKHVEEIADGYRLNYESVKAERDALKSARDECERQYQLKVQEVIVGLEREDALRAELAEEEKSYEMLTALHNESVGREEALDNERKAALSDLGVSIDAAPIGSLAGKLCTANRALRSERASLKAERDTLQNRVEELERAIADIQDQALNQDAHDACMNIIGICNNFEKGHQ